MYKVHLILFQYFTYQYLFINLFQQFINYLIQIFNSKIIILVNLSIYLLTSSIIVH